MDAKTEQAARDAFAGEPDPVPAPSSVGVFIVVLLMNIAAVALTMFFALLVLGGRADAHEAPTGWNYPLACCSNRDCTMVRADKVRETPDGYVIRLVPGDHDFINAPATFVVPYSETKDSPDGEYHLCISRALSVLCFFAGSRGF